MQFTRDETTTISTALYERLESLRDIVRDQSGDYTTEDQLGASAEILRVEALLERLSPTKRCRLCHAASVPLDVQAPCDCSGGPCSEDASPTGTPEGDAEYFQQRRLEEGGEY